MSKNAQPPPPRYEDENYQRWAKQKRYANIRRVWESRVTLAAKQVKSNKSHAKRVLSLANVLCEDLAITNPYYEVLYSEDPQREDQPLW